MDLGRIGVWSWSFGREPAEVAEVAAELEELGYGALWFPNRPQIFELAGQILGATRRIVAATGIASIWTHTPEDVTRAHRELTRAYPGRFLLGLGVSHAHVVDREQPGRYSRPLTRMREYLDRLDRLTEPVPREERALAALGPRMLELARDRTAGAHPYLVTVEHTRRARELLGPGRLLAPEQSVVLEVDPARARAVARQHLAMYLQAPNYTNNWLRLGFTPGDLENGGSDRLVDEVVAWGDLEAIAERVNRHLEAGADHVCVQVARDDGRATLPREEWRRLATLLG
ncbi:MAG TPA: LLM class F420-dependent oxidoreductase [Candidatus Dormibacteraeota bacterium]|nr:LLM class F420-dependent oxidoreductase [Candidatus Dormibacteraeota bacterium]